MFSDKPPTINDCDDLLPPEPEAQAGFSSLHLAPASAQMMNPLPPQRLARHECGMDGSGFCFPFVAKHHLKTAPSPFIIASGDSPPSIYRRQTFGICAKKHVN
jgi:hypothetical protein